MTPGTGFGIIAGIFAVAALITGLCINGYNDNHRHDAIRYRPAIVLAAAAGCIGIFAVLLGVHW